MSARALLVAFAGFPLAVSAVVSRTSPVGGEDVRVRPPAVHAQPADSFDLLIVGGSVIDGTGSAARVLDVGLRGDRIVALGASLPRARAKRIIEARGRVVSPGFIDLHAHLEPLLQLPLMESALRQGVTLALGGPDGGSPLPLGPYLDSVTTVKPGINVAYLVGHNDIRRLVMGMEARAPRADELTRMRQLVATAMGQGAFGLSTGLLYLPGTYSNIDEVIALAQAASDSGGIYTSHLRKEGIGLLDGVGEALEIGRRAKIPVVLTHHKAVGQQMWGKSVITLAMVDSARKAGTDVMIDQYPYTATHTGIGVLVPSWAMAGGNAEFRKRLAVPALKDSILRGIVDNILNDRGGGDLARVQFTRVTWDRSLEGKTLKDWALRERREPTPEQGAQLVLEAMLKGGGNAIYHVLDEQDVPHHGASADHDCQRRTSFASRRRSSTSPRVRHVPTRARRVRAYAAVAVPRNRRAQDDADAGATTRPERSRCTAGGGVCRRGGVRCRDGEGSVDLHRAAPVSRGHRDGHRERHGVGAGRQTHRGAGGASGAARSTQALGIAPSPRLRTHQ